MLVELIHEEFEEVGVSALGHRKKVRIAFPLHVAFCAPLWQATSCVLKRVILPTVQPKISDISWLVGLSSPSIEQRHFKCSSSIVTLGAELARLRKAQLTFQIRHLLILTPKKSAMSWLDCLSSPSIAQSSLKCSSLMCTTGAGPAARSLLSSVPPASCSPGARRYIRWMHSPSLPANSPGPPEACPARGCPPALVGSARKKVSAGSM